MSPDDDADEVTARLTGRYGEPGEHRDRNGMFRDFGLVEAHWQRSGPGLPWRDGFFMAQAHRLDCPPDSAPPEFAPIAERARKLGVELVERALWHDDGYTDLVATGTGVSVLVVREKQEYQLGGPVGTIVKIHVPGQAGYDDPLGALPEPRWRALRQSIRAVQAMDAQQRERWLDGHATPDPVWWHEHLRLAHVLLDGDGPLAVLLWLLDRAGERSVFSPAEVARRRACVLLESDRHPAAQVGGPIAAAAARACLAALPLTVEQARLLPPDWRDRTPGQHAAARTARALAVLAARLSPRTGELAGAVRAWEPLRGRLSGSVTQRDIRKVV